MEKYVGSFKMDRSENFEEFMKALGVGMVMRKLGGAATPTVTIKQDGDKWSLETSTTFKTSTIEFELGKEFKESRIDGVEVTSVVNFEEDKLVHKQQGDKEVLIVREFEGEELKVTCSCDGVVSTRYYKRL